MKILFVLCAAWLVSGASAEDLSFDRALSDMIEKNVDVQVQQTKLRTANNQLSAAWGAFSPNLNLTAAQVNNGGTSQTIVGAPTAQNYAANLTWNLFRSGSDFAGLKTAQSDYQTQSAALDQNYLLAEGKAALSLLDLIENKLIVEAYHRSETSAQHLLDVAEMRFKKGLLSREEMDRVAIDASIAQAKRADAEVQLNTAALSVDSQLGHHDVRLEWPWEKSLAVENVKAMLKAIPRPELEDRPDWRAARQAVNTEDEHSRQLWRKMLPYVDLQFSQLSLQAPGSPAQNGWASTATLTIPLWSGLSDYSAYRSQVETKYAAEARFSQVQRDAEGSVQTAQANYKLAFQQYQVRSKNLERAKRIMEADDARFKMGREDANALNLDLTRVTDAEILEIQGVHQVHQTYMDLYHTFGKRVP